MASSTAQEEQQPAAELPRVPSEAPSEPPEAPTYSFGPDTRSENHKKPVPNVRLPVWDGKRRTEPGAGQPRRSRVTQLDGLLLISSSECSTRRSVTQKVASTVASPVAAERIDDA